jgi:hypothetical protein
MTSVEGTTPIQPTATRGLFYQRMPIAFNPENIRSTGNYSVVSQPGLTDFWLGLTRVEGI